ncbi:hypothetical protein [Streptomyces sp. NPDC051636]|uniref:hypothetical protein n=1 Tax=Streptomyces sp. NPDC051636 TaxID=3365663 RepID=UPI0037A5E334
MDAMVHLRIFQVNVPIHHTTDKTRNGLHVFTGQAASTCDAVRIAHEVYDAAVVAQQAGLGIPGRRPDGWGVSGLRPGWEPDWTAARADLWQGRALTRVTL